MHPQLARDGRDIHALTIQLLHGLGARYAPLSVLMLALLIRLAAQRFSAADRRRTFSLRPDRDLSGAAQAHATCGLAQLSMISTEQALHRSAQVHQQVKAIRHVQRLRRCGACAIGLS